jgi:2-methylcitrate dehydratase PrpD
MPFCAAAAVVFGGVDVDTFEPAALEDARVGALMPNVAMRVDPSLDGAGPPLTEARVSITLRDGRVLRQEAQGARGYPERPASDEELAAKFMACARRALDESRARRALDLVQQIADLPDIRRLTALLQA